MFESLSSTDMIFNSQKKPFQPDTYVSLTKKHIDAKVSAAKHYTKEFKGDDHPCSQLGIITQASKRGLEARSGYAEAFKTLRRTI